MATTFSGIHRFALATAAVFVLVFGATLQAVAYEETPASMRYGEAGEWEKVAGGPKKRMTIYTRRIADHPVKEVKVESKFEYTKKEILIGLMEVEKFPEWVPLLKSVEWIQKPDENGVSYVYMVTNLPWPVKDRDVVIKTTIKYDPEIDQIYLTSNSAPGHIPPVDGLIRIPASTASWVINDDGNGTLDTVLLSHADPGGYIPNWLLNFAVTQAPKMMMKNFYKYMEEADLNTDKWSLEEIFGYPVEFKK